MNPRLLILVFFALLVPTIVLAAPVSILLRGPVDGATVSEFKVSFSYGFSQVPDMKNCSLLVNGEINATRGDLISYDNNKVTTVLDAGKHTWSITCFDINAVKIESETRSLTVDVQINMTGGYQIIYNKNSFRSYVVPISPGQDSVELPAMKTNEDIRIRTLKATHYIDVLKMGNQNGVPFVEVRDRTHAKILRILQNEGIDLALDDEEKTDVSIVLNRIERNNNAFFTVMPYPEGGSAETPEGEPGQEPPAEQAGEEEITPVGSGNGNGDPGETSSTPVKDRETTAPGVKSEGSASWLIWLIMIVAVLAAGVAAFFFTQKKGGKPEFRHTDSVKVVKEKKSEEQPLQNEPANNSAFDVIKSTSAKRRK